MSELKKEYINIGCSSNENYAQHLGVMIYSLLKNCSCPERVRIFLMDGGLFESSRERLNKIVEKFNAEIVFRKPDSEMLKGLKICRHIGIETYYRFSLIESEEYDKLLYLDADLVVNGDIRDIFDKKFEENIVFAVKDPGGSNEKKSSLGISLEKPYFNAGVLLIDCKRWKREGVTERVLKFIRENPDKIEYADQDGLNAVLVEKWRELDPFWNVLTRLCFYVYLRLKNPPNYENENIKEIIRNPKIIHYASFIKPWFFLDPSPYKSVYWAYLRETPWGRNNYSDKNLSGILRRIFYYFGIVRTKLIK